MLDIHLIREKPDVVEQSLRVRHYETDSLKKIKELDLKWREVKKEENDLRAERNKLGATINEKKKNKENADEEIRKSGEISAKIKDLSVETKTLEEKIMDEALNIPNIPHETVPVGKDETFNKEIDKWGKTEKGPDDVLSHYDIAHKTGLIDHERGVKLAQHRFTVLYGDIAKLERALINFMLSVQTSRGYLEVAPPYMVNSKTMTGTGQLPKFEKDLYKCRDDDLWLIPTAEVPLTNLYAGEVLEEKDLPIKVTAFTPCFRREAGEYGRDIKGIMRQHQFDKIELVKFAHPERSYKELESLTKDAQRILELLEIPYRTIELCTGDLGFGSAKTYDLEIWIPSQNTYREVSSCSNFTDFQARRANIKFRSGGSLEYVHTLNGSGLAVGRTLIAVLENFQEDKKTVVIPKVLRDFIGSETIEL